MIIKGHWCPFQNNLSVDLELAYEIELGDFCNNALDQMGHSH